MVNAVRRVYDRKITSSTVVSENVARTEFKGGAKQDSLALKSNGSRVVQNSHVCQCLAESA